MLTEIKVCVYDRRRLPKSDADYYEMVARHTFEKRGMRIVLDDGSFFTAVTHPIETEDRDGAMFLHVTVKEEFATLLETGKAKIKDMSFIPVAEAEAAL